MLDVDLAYPEHLHDAHNSYPLAPEGLEIGGDMLSGYCKDLREKFQGGSGVSKKLTPNLMGKEGYIVHLKKS